MKTTIALSFILAASLSQAGQLHSISTKTGKPVADSSSCVVLQPIRSAKTTVNFMRNIPVENSQDGSITYETEVICQDVSGTMPVFDFPEGAICISFSNQGAETKCSFIDTNGRSAQVFASGPIFQHKDSKSFHLFLSTQTSSVSKVDHNNVRVFDPSIQKVLLSAGNNSFSSNDPLVFENIWAEALIEDSGR